MPTQTGHRAVNRRAVFFRRQRLQAADGGQLDVDAQAVGIQAGSGQQIRRRIGNGFKVDVAAKVVVFAQHARHFNHLLHGVVRILNDAAGQKQAFNAVAAVKIKRQADNFVHAEARPGHIAADPVDAVQAVISAKVGEQDFQQRNAPTVGRIAVADAAAFRRPDAPSAQRIALAGAAGGAGRIVFSGIGEYGEFLLKGLI